MGRGLLERAERLTNAVQGAVAGPGSYLIPGPVKVIVQEMARLIEDMAREIENKGGENG